MSCPQFFAVATLALVCAACTLPADPVPPGYDGLEPSSELEPCRGTRPPGAIRVTHVGTATLILEVGPFVIITDPALRTAGDEYRFGFGTRSRKIRDPQPAAAVVQGMHFDVALVSHDQHADNLDALGRELLLGIPVTVTTPRGARRVGGHSIGLRPWQTHEVSGPDGQTLNITAVPARHGPRGTRPVVGPVTGFVLQLRGGAEAGARGRTIYISGDTIESRGLDKIGDRFDIDLAFLHLGGVQFKQNTGRMKYTMDAQDALRAIERTRPATVVPVHYDGWNHFRESPMKMRATLEASSYADRMRFVDQGTCAEF